LERFNQELKRRTRVVRIFPNDESCLRLVGMLCMEQSEQWQTGYRYLTMEPSTMPVDEPEKELSVTYVVYPLFRYASLRLHHITKVRADEFTQLFGLDSKI